MHNQSIIFHILCIMKALYICRYLYEFNLIEEAEGFEGFVNFIHMFRKVGLGLGRFDTFGSSVFIIKDRFVASSSKILDL